jgi:C1A family cysteine protease
MTVTPNGRGLGWRRQALDPRDAAHVYSAPPHLAGQLPQTVDLRKMLPPAYDQGQLGSCVGNSTAALVQCELLRRGLPEGKRTPSRLAIYYGAREMEGTINSDCGCEIRDAIKFIARNGVLFEDGPGGWPYDTSKFRNPPPMRNAFTLPETFRYQSVPQGATYLMASLAEGRPVSFGFACYSGLDDPETAKNDFSDPASGRLVMPKQNEASLGGHAVLLVGYDYPARTFLVRNSWSPQWGLRGHFMAPFEYFLRPDLASDFWNITS